MNVIFTAVFISSMIAIAICAPDRLLSSLLGGAENAVKMSLTLFCIYAVWMGLSTLAEKSGLSKSMAKGLKPLSKKIFGTDNDVANECIAMNISRNSLRGKSHRRVGKREQRLCAKTAVRHKRNFDTDTAHHRNRAEGKRGQRKPFRHIFSVAYLHFDIHRVRGRYVRFGAKTVCGS